MNNAKISLVVFSLITVLFLGCHENNNSTEGQVITESEFFNEAALTADPEKDLVVMFLEPPDAEPEENLTGELGNDVFTLRYKRSVNHTFCWEDEDGEAGHFIDLDDSEGNEIFRLNVNGECVTVLLEAGDYLMHIHHDGRDSKILPIFLIPDQDDLAQAGKSRNRLINNGSLILSKIMQSLFNSITRDALAQTVETNVNTLIKTNACPACDLSGANLFGANLSGADLTEAILIEANLAGADLIGAALNQANIAGAVLTGAVLSNANLNGASLVLSVMNGVDLSGASLNRANFTEADLTGANMISASLTQANLVTALLSGATLTDASMPGTNLSGADLSEATWCDGTFCQSGSTGTCEGTRFIFNCDGTITDTDTNLVWEKKDSPSESDSNCPGGATCDNPHDVDNRYSLSDGGDGDLTNPDGSAYTDFLQKLNNSCNNGPSVDCSAGGDEDCLNAGDESDCCGFACSRDWRIPEIGIDGGNAEIETILDLQTDLMGICIGPNSACIDPVFGPTAPDVYWTANDLEGFIGEGSITLDFSSGIAEDDRKDRRHHVRAVRQ